MILCLVFKHLKVLRFCILINRFHPRTNTVMELLYEGKNQTFVEEKKRNFACT